MEGKNCDNEKEMILVEGGSFMMGSGDGYAGLEPVHKLTLNSFWIGKYPVTFSEYEKYCKDAGVETPGDEGWGRDSRPAINVSWYDAIRYCNWLSKKEGLTPCYSVSGDTELNGYDDRLDGKEIDCDFSANGYRLPTDAEWEFSARGGAPAQQAGTFNDRWAGTDVETEIGNYAWYENNAGDGLPGNSSHPDYGTHPVGTKRPNELGLYDMSGNVWNWVWDIRANYPTGSHNNPTGPTSGTGRVVRGGGWGNGTSGCTVSRRFSVSATDLSGNVGFRISRVSS